MANEAKIVFGSSTTVLTADGTTPVSNGNWSVGGTSATLVELDNSTALYPLANATLTCTWGTNPTAGTTVDLYMYIAETDYPGGSSNDETAPSATAVNGAHYVGSFKCTANTSAQYMQTVISLAGIRKANFSVYNGSGQSLPATAWNVKIVPFTYGPT